LKDMICRGGEKIFPREVEEFLFTHPAIAEAYVFGVADDYYGEEVAAWVRLKAGERLTEQDVRQYCRARIMDYKVPRRVKFVTEFPTTVTGKIQKFRMREAMEREIARRRAASASPPGTDAERIEADSASPDREGARPAGSGAVTPP
jgi:fatty-acyl-CoA synthase